MTHEQEALRALQGIPNIGKSMAKDLYSLGYRKPADLKGEKPLEMYRRLSEKTGTRQDPCVLDTFMSAVHFAETGESRKWWEFTAERKANYNGQL